jgi:thiol:disulfide interchange protein DsbD
MLMHKDKSKSKNILVAISILGSFLWPSVLLPGSSVEKNQEEGVVTVETYVSLDGVHPGGTIELALLLDILPGWHIHGADLADQFLIASTLMIDENDEVKVLETYYPEAMSRLYSYSEIELKVYEGEVVLGAFLRINDDARAGQKTLKASFLYQACDDQSCMAPQTINLEIPFRVVAASTEVKEINKEIFSKIKFKK